MNIISEIKSVFSQSFQSSSYLFFSEKRKIILLKYFSTVPKTNDLLNLTYAEKVNQVLY